MISAQYPVTYSATDSAVPFDWAWWSAGFGQTLFADTYFGMGLASEPLRRGYDCPLYATYVNALVNWGQSGPVALSDAICMVSDHSDISTIMVQNFVTA